MTIEKQRTNEDELRLIPQMKWWEHQEAIKGKKTIPSNNGFDMVDVFQPKEEYKLEMPDYNGPSKYDGIKLA